MASSRSRCQALAPALLSSCAGISTASRRSSSAASSAASQRASNSCGRASMNSSDASSVSGLVGSSLWRRRSASSLAMELRCAKPKSASSVVMSSCPVSAAHQACRRARVSADCSAACTSWATRSVAACTTWLSPRTQSSRAMSCRWRCAAAASGSRAASSCARSARLRLNAAPVAWPAGPGRRRSRPRAGTGRWGSRTARRPRPRTGSCHACCRWPCAGGSRWCIQRPRRA